MWSATIPNERANMTRHSNQSQRDPLTAECGHLTVNMCPHVPLRSKGPGPVLSYSALQCRDPCVRQHPPRDIVASTGEAPYGRHHPTTPARHAHCMPRQYMHITSSSSHATAVASPPHSPPIERILDDSPPAVTAAASEESDRAPSPESRVPSPE